MEDIEELINEANNKSEKSKAIDPVSKLIQESNYKASNSNDKSSIIGFNTPIGESRFDEGFLPNMQTNYDDEFESDLEDYRSKNQSVPLKTIAGLSRVANKVGTEIAKIPGYIGGAIGASFAEDGQGMDTFVNNSWIKAIEGYEEHVNSEVLPVYVKKAVKEGNLWDNVSSIDFWANEGSDGLGFMLSMLLPGIAISKAGVGTKMLSGMGKSTKGAELLSKMDQASKVLGLESAAGAIDLTLATTVNTLFEAGSEANGAMKNVERKPNETDKEYNQRKGRIGRDVFVSNVGILALPNLILNKQVLKLGKQGSRLGKYGVTSGEIGERVSKNSFFDNIWNSKALSILSKDVPREAMEELSQSVAEEYWQNNDTLNPREIFETYLDVIKTTDAQKAMLLGGLFGGLGGTFGAYNESKANKKRDNYLLDAMNTSSNFYEKSLTGFYKKDSKGNILFDEETNEPQYDYGKLKDQANAIKEVEKLNQTLELAKATNNQNLYKLTLDKIETSLITDFIKAGQDGIQVLKEKLEDSKAFEEEINDSNKQFNSDINKEDRINSIITKANDTLKDYEFFKTYGRILSGFKVKPENKDIYNNFINNLSDLYITTNSQIKEVKKIINDISIEKSKFESELNLEENESDPILDNINKNIKELEDYKNTLSQQRKDILNPKKQKELFDELFKEYNEQQEVIEKSKEEAKKQPTVEQEEEIKAKQNEIKKTLKEEKETQKEIKIAKEQVNDFYGVAKELFDNFESYDLAKNKKTGEVTNSFGDKHIKPIKKYITDLKKTDLVIIEKSLNSEGQEVFDISLERDNGSVETIRVENFNVKEEEPEIVQSDDENISNNDSEYDSEDNMETNMDISKEEILSETNDPDHRSIEKKHVKTVVSRDQLMTSPEFKEFQANPVNKTDQDVTFEVGYAGTNMLAKEASSLYNNIVSNDFNITDEQKQFLIKHLPIRVIFGNINIFTHLFTEDGSSRYKLDNKEIELRTNIIEKALENKTLDGIKSKIKFQLPGIIQLDKDENGIPANNSPLEIKGINKLSDVKFVYTGQDNILKTPDGEVSSLAKSSKHKGSIFMIIPMANGREFPLKLNSRRINESEADILLTLTEKMLTPQLKIRYKTNISKNIDLLGLNEEQVKLIKEESKALNKNFNSLTVIDLISSLVFEGNSPKNKYKFIGTTTLEYGDNKVTINDFNSKKEEIKQFLTTQKNRNIKVRKLSETPYKKYVLDNILFTDVKLGDNVFKGNINIYINPSLNESKKEVNKTNKEESIKKVKSRSRGKALGKLKKGLNQMKKDNDQNSDTLC